jgi:hypothetical protein
MSDARNIRRCREEIADSERSLRDGHPDLQGLCLALADWSAELRIIEGKMRVKARKPARAEAGRAEMCTDGAYFGRL